MNCAQDISIADCNGWNVFHYVSSYRNDEWWLDKYVNDDNKLKELLNRKNIYGRTSLHCAASIYNHQYIKWLLLNGADVNATDKYGTLADGYGDAETRRLILGYRNK